MMKAKDDNEARKLVNSLCRKGEKVIQSEYFRNLNYLIKDKHIIVLAGLNGELAVKLELLEEFINELKEIGEFYKHDRGGKCLVLNGKGKQKR